MAKYKLTNQAVKDLNSIWVYTFDKWSEQQADKYYQSLIDFCQDIADNPKLGKNYDKIRNDIFGLKANKHVIFYRVITDCVEITRILHGTMDLKTRIRE